MLSTNGVEIAKISNDLNGAILTLASSAACILGSFVICSDLVWRWIFPNSKFDLNNNQGFLVCSLSFSSGVLIFTSMYKLLPQGLDYYNKSTLLQDSPRLANAMLIITYMLGIAICSVINTVIHALTSQSVVHCAHDNPSNIHGHSHSHSHSHAHGIEDPSITQNHEQTHTHNYHSIDSDSNIHTHSHNTGINYSSESLNDRLARGPVDPQSVPEPETSGPSSTTSESSPLLIQSQTDDKSISRRNASESAILKRKSIIDITQWKIRGQKCVGKCMGYSNIEDCCEVCANHELASTDPHTIFDYVEPETMIHRHIHFNQPTTDAPPHHRSSSCVPPERATFFDDSIHHPTPRSERSLSNQPEISEVSFNPAYRDDPAPHLNDASSRHFSDFSTRPCSPDEENHEEEIHHHHISTRYSHLFSIGLQTAFAISVHKIPEGFLTFATSHADRELGFSVFVALAIHNFSEGFTIAFPLFLALQSRFYAIMSAVVLGGMSQPLGALLAWALFKYGLIPSGDDGMSNNGTQFVFGLIVSITAGFLSIIGLQMYGTAISFGGNQTMTLACAFTGIAIIGLGSSLTAH